MDTRTTECHWAPLSSTELHCPIFCKTKKEKKQASSLFRRPDACKLHCRKQVKCFKVLCPACEHSDDKLNGLLQLYRGLSVNDGEDSRSKWVVKKEQSGFRVILWPAPVERLTVWDRWQWNRAWCTWQHHTVQTFSLCEEKSHLNPQMTFYIFWTIFFKKQEFFKSSMFWSFLCQQTRHT